MDAASIDWEAYIKGECAQAAARRREEILVDEILTLKEGWTRQRAINAWNRSGRYGDTTLAAAQALLSYEANWS